MLEVSPSDVEESSKILSVPVNSGLLFMILCYTVAMIWIIEAILAPGQAEYTYGRCRPVRNVLRDVSIDTIHKNESLSRLI